MKKPFSAWREGAVLYGSWIAFGLCAIAAAWPRPTSAVGFAILAAGLFALFFFRDPKRAITAGKGEIVSPADGTIVAIEDLADCPYYDGPCRRISIFLSVFSVHVNRSPAAGAVRSITYQPGRFRVAVRPETSDCNEANTLFLDTDHGPMTVRQIAGIVARRIVCRVGVGDRLEKGEKFGMIKFGSRTELYLPPTAEVCAIIGQKMRAGTSRVARLQ